MRKRIQHWLWDGQYKFALWLDDKGHSKWCDRLADVQRVLIEEPGKWLLCKLGGHDAMADCGDPAHDCCVWCGRSMPGQAPRVAVK